MPSERQVAIPPQPKGRGFPRFTVTTEMVLTEFLNFFSKFGPLFRAQAAQVVIRLQQQADVTIIGQTDEQFQAGLSLYARYKDKGWGQKTKAGDTRTASHFRSCGSAA